MASKSTYEFYAELIGYKPKIWRRFQISNTVTMAQFAYVLMTLFEMQASHLYSFDVNAEENLYITSYDDDFDTPCFRANTTKLDAVEHKLKSIVSYPNENFIFTYDFGDGWEISLELEKIIIDEELSSKELPRALEGEGFGIIEDCGGIGGLTNLAKAFKKKKGSNYKDYCEWLGVDDLDLNTFDLNEMNERLKKIPKIYKKCYEHAIPPSDRAIKYIERR